MTIHNGYENLNLVNPVVTLGIFDGVHRGHMVLLETLVSRAKDVTGESVVITFTPHPRQVLDKNFKDLSFLTTTEEKMVLLEKANIDHLILVEFTRNFSKILACDFVLEVLVKKLGTKHLIIGFNHHFGRSGKGDLNTIKQCTESMDFKVEQVQGIHTEEGAISSSSIREALLSGRLDDANRLLGYPYSINGTIVEGRKIGRELGFPTANIEPDNKFKLIPANGVYAVETVLNGKRYLGMSSIGSNPTVNSDERVKSIEVNIFELDENIYGMNISVSFMKWLRGEIKFENRKELTDQMKLDKMEVLRLLS